MADVAKLAGVSSATVSRALAHSPVVNEETRKRVLEVVKQSGYRINRNAQRLREKRANAIAVVSDSVASTARQVGAPTMAHTLLSETVKALATREKAVLLLAPDGASLPRCQSLLAEQSVDGLIFLTSRDKELLNRLHARKIPLVAWDGDRTREPYCAVTGDAGRAGRLAGRHLADSGCSAALFVHFAGDSLAPARLAGLSAGMKRRTGSVQVRRLEVEDRNPYGVCSAVVEWRKGAATVDAMVASEESCTLGIAWAGDLCEAAFGNRAQVLGIGTVGMNERMPGRVIAVEQDLAEAGDLLVEKLLGRLEGIEPVPTILPVHLHRGAVN